MPERPATPVARFHRSIAPAIALTGVLSILLFSNTTCADTPATPPDIVLIMSDDMGFSDIGCYGSEIQTPNLDSLAAGGVRFTQFYNTARCCPTRACLMTGLYPHQAGVGHMLSDTGLAGYTSGLNRNCVTIAEALKPAGYRTYMAGKWHVTRKVRPQTEADKDNWPCQRGFDRFFGTIHGAGSFYDPNSLTRDNELIVPESDDFFYTDAISDNAATFIRHHAKNQAEAPFFMYVAYTAAHWPMHAREENIAKYKGAYDKGWDAMRDARRERMIEMGLIDADWKMTGRDPRSPAWEEARDKEWDIRNMEVYAAMVDCMDQGIGRIVDALRETDRLDNTLILFVQDNGGCAEGLGRGDKITYRDKDPDRIKPMQPGELQFDMIPKRTRDGRALRMGRGAMAGPADTYIAYGLSWANASNTPFREYKHWVHEGGVSTPLIAHWPQGISESRIGRLEHQPGHLIDVMATCVDVGGADYPKTITGQEITPMEGVSLVPAMGGESLDRPNPIFWEHEANCAIREGKWKLVCKGSQGTGITTPWELYDMEADRTETNDLAAENPEKVKELAGKWEAWAERAKVKPWPWGRKRRKTTAKLNSRKEVAQ